MAGAVVQNTVEQTGLAIVTHLIVAAVITRSNIVIATLTALFAIGRLSFWTNYKYGAARRAFGFALTFYPTIVALLASAVIVIFDLSI